MFGSKTSWQLVLASLLVLLSGGWTQLASPASAQLISVSSQPNECIRPAVSSGNLTLEICTSQVHYRIGELVDITLILTNSGPETIQLDTLTSNIIVMDRLGALKLRQADLNLCLTPQSCSISPGQSTSRALATWATGEPFSQATLSGPYVVHASVSTCPTGAPCLEVVDAMLRITVSVPQN
jgi:hypothetical protein